MAGAKQSYGFIAKTFHWVTALVILGLLSLGFYMESLTFSPFKLELYGLHKSFGILVLGLVALRFLWRSVKKPPAALATHRSWEKALARAIHILLYIALFAMPLTGWLMSSAGGFPAGFFGLFELPPLSAKNEALFSFMREIHGILAFIIIGAVGLHVAGAFKHHFIDGDTTLKRMTSKKFGEGAGFVLAALVGIFLLIPLSIAYQTSVSSAPDKNDARQEEAGDATPAYKQQVASDSAWVILPDQSQIKFEASQYGQTFTGLFREFDGEIYFDPDNLEASKAEITINIASIKTGSDDRDGQALSPEWFDTDQYPTAVFETESFSQLDANRYVAQGHLTIRDVKLPLELPFSLIVGPVKDESRTARMNSEIALNRLDFGIGQGQWESTEAIGNEVKINIHLEVTQDVPAGE